MPEWTQANLEAQMRWPAGLVEQAASEHVTGLLLEAGWQQQSARRCQVQGCAGTGLLRLNGGWACSRLCLEKLLRLTVFEEQSHATAAEFEVRPRVRLGRILVEQGTINEAQLEQALRSQQAAGAGRLGCWLKQQVELPEAEFAAALAIQWHCPVFKVGTFSPPGMVNYLPRPLVEEHGALPLRVTGEQPLLSIGFEDHVDHGLMHAVERMHGISVDAGLLVASDFWQVTRELLGGRFPVTVTTHASSIETMAAAMGQFLVEAAIEGAIEGAVADARLVCVHDCYWLRLQTRRATLLAPRDVLCRIRPSRADGEAMGATEEAEALARQMLRVLL